MAQKIPSLAQLQALAVNQAGIEGIRQSLYDNLVYPQAGVNQLVFFQNPQGQGFTSALGGVVGQAKSVADTNMEASGQLPAGKTFLITSIEVPFYAGLSAAANTYTIAPPEVFNGTAAAAVLAQVGDVNQFYQSGSLKLFIGSKTYLEEAPLMRFPPKCHLQIDGAIGLAGTNAQPGTLASVSAKAVGRYYDVDPNIPLVSTQNFVVQLNWPGALALPSGFNGRVGVILDGFMYRNSQ
jgi:hypothetical protein